MRLDYIKSVGFRNLGSDTPLILKFSKGINVLYGLNAQGKTNLIEAVYFCATTRSFRTSTHRELIQFGKETAHLQAVVFSGNTTPLYQNRIDISLRGTSKTTVAKIMAVNGVPIDKLGDLLGVLYCVIFSPEDLNLIKSGPSERRRFIDMELCQINKVYYYEIKQYYHVLKQRNALLKILQKNASAALLETLEAWNEQLSEIGGRIFAIREGFINNISVLASKIHHGLCGESFKAVYKPSVRSEEFLSRLRKNQDMDIKTGTTSIGIHKDDTMFLLDGLDSRIYGSQGQQRTAALSLKLAEVELIRKEKNETPVLLLDDVMSELDAKRQEQLMCAINGLQTIITCTGHIPPPYLKEAVLFHANNGEIIQVKNA